MTEPRTQGLLDTSVLVDLPEVPPDALPATTYVSAVTLAELAQGVHMARDAAVRARRLERLQEVENLYRSPLPFDEAAARSYGLLVGLVVAAGRDPRPRRMDLMIAATAAAHGLPLFTRNDSDLRGLESALRVNAV